MKHSIMTWLSWGVGLLLCASFAVAGSLQTQMAMQGDVEVDVMKAKVSGDILTVVLAYRNNGDWEKFEYPVDDVHYLEKQGKKKYHLLKDDSGRYLADPVHRDKFTVVIDKGARKMAWFKFPAPPEGISNIDLSIPGVIPFDELPISR